MSVNLTMQRLTCISVPYGPMDSNTSREGTWLLHIPNTSRLFGSIEIQPRNDEHSVSQWIGVKRTSKKDTMGFSHEISWNNMKYGASQRFKIFRNQLTQQKSRMVRAPEIHPTGPRHPTPWHTSIDRRERPLSLWTSGRSQRPPSNLGNIR